MNPKKDFSALKHHEDDFKYRQKSSKTTQLVGLVCGDGVNTALDRYAMENFGLSYIAKVTRPGIEKYIHDTKSFTEINSVNLQLHEETRTYCRVKNPPALIVASHVLCAGNDCALEEKTEQTYSGCENIAHFWTDLAIQRDVDGNRYVIGVILYPDPSDSRDLYGGCNWITKEICRVPMKKHKEALCQ